MALGGGCSAPCLRLVGGAFPLEPGLEEIDRPDAHRTGDRRGARYEREALAEGEALLVCGEVDPIGKHWAAHARSNLPL